MTKGVPTFIGSKTEVALLQLAKNNLGLDDLAAERSSYKVKQLIPFDSARKCMGMVIKHNNGYRLLVKGAAEIMLANSTKTISNVYDKQYKVTDMTSQEKENIGEYAPLTIIFCVALISYNSKGSALTRRAVRTKRHTSMEVKCCENL